MIIELSASGLYVSVSKGFLLISQAEKQDKIPLSDVDALVLSSHAATISTATFQRFFQYNIPVVICGTNAIPCSLCLPYGINVYRKERIQLQISASLPLKKNLWQQIIKAKISNQTMLLALLGKKHNDIMLLSDKVRSGDPDNTEAHAARIYWSRLFGNSFKRDPELLGINSFLNYAYAILRASVCRYLVGSGLIPELGLHHHNQMNPYCLADDLMEPYRPFVDMLVASMDIGDNSELTPIHKQILVSLLDLELTMGGETTHLKNCINQSIQSFVKSLANKKATIRYPALLEGQYETIKLLLRGITTPGEVL